jgi:hypothetical protein
MGTAALRKGAHMSKPNTRYRLIVVQSEKGLDDVMNVTDAYEDVQKDWEPLILIREEIGKVSRWNEYILLKEVIVYGTISLTKDQYFEISRRTPDSPPEFINAYLPHDLEQRLEALTKVSSADDMLLEMKEGYSEEQPSLEQK